MSKNLFKSLAEFYKESVKEEDKLGYSEYYLKAFKLFVEKFNKEDKLSFTVTDVEYLSGYYIFGSGTNSVVHFHVKECPGWKFGVWFTGSKDDYGTAIKGNFFCQYEECIDKFKPTASVYFDEFSVRFDEDGESYVSSTWKIYKILRFIKQHPLRAWASDYCGYNYNLEYVSPVKILFDYISYKSQNCFEKILKPILDKNMINYTMKLFYPTIETNVLAEGWEVEVRDREDLIFPKYSVLVKLPDNCNVETGHYSMFDEDEKDLQERWDKREKLLSKIASIFNVYWCSPVYDSITFWKEEEQEEDV